MGSSYVLYSCSCAGDLTDRGPLFHISVKNFSEEVLPGLACTDTVLVIQDKMEPFDQEFVNRCVCVCVFMYVHVHVREYLC